ncbi:MAG TPA: sugar phosphate nucleotidyltransferase, partial [Candidatus Omnitrophota bacterium]|nr:sugar phosphate nucleotidyltransferase [Candidatus Omnitrophota bacterium]
GSFRHFTIPYGICHMGNGGSLIDIEEKPEYDYLVNTGMYCLSKNVLSQIPRNRPFDITDLIKKVKNSGGGVGVFPVDEKSWIDVGQWEEYRRAIKHLEFDA